MVNNITTRDIIREVRKLAKESPDCIYTRGSCNCSNIDGICSNGSEGCIIGQALVRLGVPKQKFIDLNMQYEGITGLCYNLNIPENTLEEDWLDEVQGRQDIKKSWGNAVHSADLKYGVLGI